MKIKHYNQLFSDICNWLISNYLLKYNYDYMNTSAIRICMELWTWCEGKCLMILIFNNCFTCCKRTGLTTSFYTDAHGSYLSGTRIYRCQSVPTSSYCMYQPGDRHLNLHMDCKFWCHRGFRKCHSFSSASFWVHRKVETLVLSAMIDT